jgi:hypothetical protein
VENETSLMSMLLGMFKGGNSNRGGKDQQYAGQKYATPQDTSAGLVAGQPNDPMYGQMMQQAMQGQNQQQPQRQMMTPAGMPQMPGAVHPNATWDTLLKMLSGGG